MQKLAFTVRTCLSIENVIAYAIGDDTLRVACKLLLCIVTRQVDRSISAIAVAFTFSFGKWWKHRVVEFTLCVLELAAAHTCSRVVSLTKLRIRKSAPSKAVLPGDFHRKTMAHRVDRPAAMSATVVRFEYQKQMHDKSVDAYLIHRAIRLVESKNGKPGIS